LYTSRVHPTNHLLLSFSITTFRISDKHWDKIHHHR
jgi:hypothetical protein